MAIAMEALLIFSAGMLPPILGSLLFEKFQESHKKLTNIENLIRLWGAAVITITAVLYVAINQTNGLRSIGIQGERFSKNFGVAYWTTGLLALIVIAWAEIFRLRNKGKQQEPAKMDPTSPLLSRIVGYRQPIEKSAYLTVLSLLVIGEDLLSRGYLVLMMANRTGVLLPWVLLSILFSVTCHLYQGRNRTTVIVHSLFAIYFIGVTLVTKNIIAAIAPHLAYDILWTASMWKGLDRQSPESGKPLISNREKLFYFSFIAVNLTFLLYFLVSLI